MTAVTGFTVIGPPFSSVFFFFAAAAVLILVLNILTSIWVYRDAVYKGNSREFSALMLIGTLFFPIIGLIVYLIIRND
ncbi:PLDc N-terminal domain-containing protein [Alkalicoccus chagannorensis]|uniref:PLDc N-terminal domain-containing protein n=1 Tax=Alkalicoccus chagannorensis TaxID=427072 RepID=UPI0004270949|nr:PLDc N-terminal domain-containing protein [Alkalicoccus chagannorensis]